MLGWHISVYRLAEPNHLSEFADAAALAATLSTPSELESLIAHLVPGNRIAVWQTYIRGIDWLDRLVATQEALALTGSGYPNRYLALGGHLMQPILEGPPEAKAHWTYDDHDVRGSKWEGKTVINRTEALLIRPQEWLLVEAWDES